MNARETEKTMSDPPKALHTITKINYRDIIKLALALKKIARKNKNYVFLET